MGYQAWTAARPTPWPCKAAAGVDSPVTRHAELGALFATRGVKKLSERLGSLQRTELPCSEVLSLTCLSSLAAQRRDQSTHPAQLPGEPTPLVSLQTYEANDMGLDPKQDGRTAILMSATHHILRHLSPVPELPSQICFSEQAPQQPALHARGRP